MIVREELHSSKIIICCEKVRDLNRKVKSANEIHASRGKNLHVTKEFCVCFIKEKVIEGGTIQIDGESLIFKVAFEEQKSESTFANLEIEMLFSLFSALSYDLKYFIILRRSISDVLNVCKWN